MERTIIKDKGSQTQSLCGFTQHIIATSVMAILSADQQTHSIPRHAEVTKTRPRFDDDIRCVTLAQHIIALIVMAIPGADHCTQTHDIHGGHVDTVHGMGAVSNLRTLGNDGRENTRHVGNLSYANTCNYVICNPSQNDVYIHTVKTPWEVQRKAIRSGDKGKTHSDSPSLGNYKQPKSFFVEIFPNPIDEKEKGHD